MLAARGTRPKLRILSFRSAIEGYAVCPRLFCQGAPGVPLGMSKIHPEYLGLDHSDREVAVDVLVRQEPDEEEEEDDGDGEEDDDDDDKEDDGYSE
jgi:hypothetical protein